jgi:hypothetical protein
MITRILNTKPFHELEEGERYREFRGKNGRIEIQHYVAHRERRYNEQSGTHYTNFAPYYDCTLSVNEFSGRWYVMYWHGGNGTPQYMPWAYRTAEEACEAMLVASDCILDD